MALVQVNLCVHHLFDEMHIATFLFLVASKHVQPLPVAVTAFSNMHSSTSLNARLVSEEMPSRYTTTVHSVSSMSSLLFYGAINIHEARRAFNA